MQRPREYLRPHHLRTSQCHLALVADVEEAAVAVDDVDEGVTEEGQVSNHTPRPITNRPQAGPQHRAQEGSHHLPEEAEDVEDAARHPRTRTKNTIIGTHVSVAVLTCPVGTTAQLARDRACTATRKSTLARRARSTLPQGTSPQGEAHTKSIFQSQERSGANDW